MKTIVGVIFLVFVIIFGLTALEKDRALFYYELNGSNTTSTTATISSSSVTVKITGCVANPGSYSVSSGSYLDDVINLAGGITLDADSDCFNYYYVIEDSIDIYIAKVTDTAKTSINEASIEDLKQISGIGITIATRIVEYRVENGDFEYLEQIMKVTGVGKSIFNSIKNKICL